MRWALASLVLLAACADDPTQLVVVVDTDLGIPTELDAVRVEVVTPSGERPEPIRQALSAQGDLPRWVTLVHRGGPLGPIEIEAVGSLAGGDVVRRQASASFVAGQTRTLRLELLRRCVDVTCPLGRTCGGDGCRDPAVAEEELERWTGGVSPLGPSDPPDAGPPPECVEETCNRRDDDCDGEVDEGLVESDPNNCGGCDRVCPVGPHAARSCVDGVCLLECEDGFADCNLDGTDGCEADLSAAVTCGACDETCAEPTPMCVVEGGAASCREGCGAEAPTPCAGRCVDTASDPDHCGGCDRACPDPMRPGAVAACADGGCGFACAAGAGDCDGDPDNGCETSVVSDESCGGCGRVCAPAAGVGRCDGGACEIVACDPGFGDCNADPADGCEARLTSSAHCGACDAPCARPGGVASCATGACELIGCAAGFADCNADPADGCERALSAVTSCGGCDALCDLPDAVEVCVDGRCAIDGCEDGLGDCDRVPGNGCEASLTTAVDCGACGERCTFPHASGLCVDGACAMGDCADGWDDCNGDPADGCETDLSAAATCGACDVACSGTRPVCDRVTRTCIRACVLPTPTLCGGTCVNLNTAPDHCGGCDVACAVERGEAACAARACVVGECDPGFGDCNDDPVDGCETPLTTRTDCGACGVACERPGGVTSCHAGACVLLACEDGFGDCNDDAADGCETPLTTATDCGGCGVACALPGATSSCASGACEVAACDDGLGDCDRLPGDGCETPVDTLADCGACGRACSPFEAVGRCDEGVCAIEACTADHGDCNDDAADGCETALDTLTDCGGCGVACAPGERCAGGVCG